MIWQVLTLLVSELRTLCECIGAVESMDNMDVEQAARQLESGAGSRGPCFFEVESSHSK